VISWNKTRAWGGDLWCIGFHCSVFCGMASCWTLAFNQNSRDVCAKFVSVESGTVYVQLERYLTRMGDIVEQNPNIV
jgi:hypothetical protein